MKNFLIALIFNTRSGKLAISRSAHNKMTQYGLNTADIEDAFRYGKDEGMGKYTRIYRGQTVVIVVAENDENEYLVTTCWKYKNWK